MFKLNYIIQNLYLFNGAWMHLAKCAFSHKVPQFAHRTYFPPISTDLFNDSYYWRQYYCIKPIKGYLNYKAVFWRDHISSLFKKLLLIKLVVVEKKLMRGGIKFMIWVLRAWGWHWKMMSWYELHWKNAFSSVYLCYNTLHSSMCYSLFLNVNNEFFTIEGEDTEQQAAVKLQLCHKVCIQISHAQKYDDVLHSRTKVRRSIVV